MAYYQRVLCLVQIVNLQTIHTVSYIDATVRTLLDKVGRMLDVHFIGYIGCALAGVVEFLDSLIVRDSIYIGISRMLVQDNQAVASSQIDEIIIYIYPIGALLGTTHAVSTVIIYYKSVLSFTYIDVFIVADTYVLAIYRIDFTHLS